MEQKDNQPIASVNDQSFQILKENGDFEITPCTAAFDFEDKTRFQKLELSSAQKMHISALAQQIPSMLSAGAMSQAYTVHFPKGLPHTLTALKQGGYGSMIQGEKGRFVGSASFYEMSTQAAIMGAFTAMSVATGQYFLAEINSEMKMMQLKLDKILEFLYGDKKAELMAEVSFVKYACQNFHSIMAHEVQREATIISLQEAKKVAMKDIEFYMGDLDSAVNGEMKDYAAIEQQSGRAFQIRDSLALSVQLYAMSNLLEMYYAENHDSDYVQYLESEMSFYINKCDSRMLSSFSVLNSRIDNYKPKLGEKIDKSGLKEKTGSIVDSLKSGEESPMRKALHSALHAATQKADYYLSQDGNVYAKLA